MKRDEQFYRIIFILRKPLISNKSHNKWNQTHALNKLLALINGYEQFNQWIWAAYGCEIKYTT